MLPSGPEYPLVLTLIGRCAKLDRHITLYLQVVHKCFSAYNGRSTYKKKNCQIILLGGCCNPTIWSLLIFFKSMILVHRKSIPVENKSWP